MVQPSRRLEQSILRWLSVSKQTRIDKFYHCFLFLLQKFKHSVSEELLVFFVVDFAIVIIDDVTVIAAVAVVAILVGVVVAPQCRRRGCDRVVADCCCYCRCSYCRVTATVLDDELTEKKEEQQAGHGRSTAYLQAEPQCQKQGVVHTGNGLLPGR